MVVRRMPARIEREGPDRRGERGKNRVGRAGGRGSFNRTQKNILRLCHFPRRLFLESI